jgi:hypothetical protein
MKKLFLSLCILAIGIASFAQAEKTNGTIYINHPYIDAVNKSVASYMSQNVAVWRTLYADTAKFSITGIAKSFSIQEQEKYFGLDFKYFTNITMKPYGYPDYLHYEKDNAMVVQSWWIWSGKSKKTGKEVKILFVMFDDFNSAGKIVSESSFGDFTEQLAEEGIQQ